MEIVTRIPGLNSRTADSHKGDFGKVCIIAGSFGMSGAAALAGRAALRAGAGLVRVAVPKSILPIVASLEPCFTTIPLPEDNQGRISSKAKNSILAAACDNEVLAIGPGTGQSRSLKLIIEALLNQDKVRLIIDADGLNNLSKINNWHDKTKADLILTPHPGELKRLWTGLFRKPLPTQRQDQAVELAQYTKSIVILKGAGTIVTDGQKIYTNKTGNPGMATAGTGDVLTGVITALAGQKLNNFDASVLGVYIHGLAGDIAAQTTAQVSLIATDIINSLPAAFLKS